MQPIYLSYNVYMPITGCFKNIKYGDSSTEYKIKNSTIHYKWTQEEINKYENRNK